MSGCLEARCKVCSRVFNWHLNNFPFVDSEIIGTCNKCIEKKDHEIYHENIVEEEDCPAKVGKIIFDKKGYHFTTMKGKVVSKEKILKLMYSV